MITRILRRISRQTSSNQIYIHACKIAYPRIPNVIVPDIQSTPLDVAIAKRLLIAYRLASESFQARQSGKDDLWTITKNYQRQFLELLSRNNPEELAAYLCNMSRHDATIGTVQGNHEFHRIKRNPIYRRFLSIRIKDQLVALAEAVCALACENPEQGLCGKNIHMDSDTLVDNISSVIGIKITPPNIDGGLLKIKTTRGLFDIRDLNAIYTAYLLSKTVRTKTERICEIGGGIGKVAYWSHLLGFKSYTIIDLPHINVLQGYYLLKTLPEGMVRLYGESIENGNANLEILPAFEIEQIHSNRYQIVLNQDSFPEIDGEVVTGYLKWIHRVSSGYFLSINHESKSPYGEKQFHISVPELINDVGGYDRMYRFPYWLRKGYVVELYRVNKNDFLMQKNES
jgi:hypothetical protein